VKKKTTLNLALVLSVFGIGLTTGTNCFAQTQTITLATTQSYALTTNEIVQIISLAESGQTGQGIVTPSTMPYVILYSSTGISVTTTNIGTYTGLTNVAVVSSWFRNFSGWFCHFNYYGSIQFIRSFKLRSSRCNCDSRECQW
jgi:hypothetical protein